MESSENLRQELLKSFHALKRSIFQSSGKGKVNGLTQSEFFMLMRISECIYTQNEERMKNEEPPLPGIRISTLSHAAQSSMPGVSQTINILENAGYVERITTKKDRRVVYVNLTQKGQDFLKNAPRKMLDLLDKAIIKMGIEESTHFIHLMGEFSTIITELTSSSDSKDTQDKERT